MAGGLHAEWVERMRAASVLQVARELGYKATDPRGAGGGNVQGCPACNAEKRHTKTRDKRGAVGIRSDGKGWQCFQCGATGDALRFVELAIAGRPWGDMSDDDKARVREWCMQRLGLDGGSSPSDYQPPAPILTPAPPPEPPKYIPGDALRAFWGSCVRMESPELPPEVFAWMVAKRIDLATAAELDLARAIPNGAPCPPWATFRLDPPPAPRSTWPELGYRVVVRMADAMGHTRGLRVRNVLASKEGIPKTLAPKGYSCSGLVFACPTARKMLATGEAPAGLVVEIVEGEKKFMQRATLAHETKAVAAIIGIEQGSWKAEHAARIPEGVRVAIKTDPDAQGAAYASAILRTLEARHRAGALRVGLASHYQITTHRGQTTVRLTA